MKLLFDVYFQFERTVSEQNACRDILCRIYVDALSLSSSTLHIILLAYMQQHFIV